MEREPDHVQIVFGRKIPAATPGRFRTRIVTNGVHPQIHALYKHAKVKQYFKHGRALRTETVINDPGGFGVGRTLNSSSRSAPASPLPSSPLKHDSTVNL